MTRDPNGVERADDDPYWAEESTCPECGAHTYRGRILSWECSRCEWVWL